MDPAAKPPTTSRRQLGLGIAGLAVAAAGGALTARWLAARHAQAAVTTVALVYPVPRALPPFALLAQDGSAFDAARLRGRYTFLLFGYTNCPDVCPTTLLALKAVRTDLADLAPALQPQVALITVDPKRDTPERLGAYTAHFDPSFFGVSGSEAAIDALALAIGVAIERGPERDGSYSVDHTAALFLIDPDAHVAAVFPTPHEAPRIAADYRAILHGAKSG
jgi:protein SCO1/2